MARGIRLEVDTDILNRCVWIVDFLTDEWDRESSIGQLAFRYREDALKQGRMWLNGKLNSINELEEAIEVENEA
jgi:hypothetical protein